tara:strand:+ start:617 stop:1738 length:1122 start_codon:yes stop_codon:yes gene_type:complete
MTLNKKFFPVYQPILDNNESFLVQNCIKENWISSKGKYIEKFEKSFSKKFGYRFSTAVSNGTVALHLALLALGIKKGDEVIIPSMTFVAVANAVTYVGAKPVFADINSDNWTINPKDIVRKITKKTKALICVHIYGASCDLKKINKILKRKKIFLIEDCAEAIGSKYNNKYVGNFGDISTFSFYGNKTITTGEGGMVITKNKKLDERVKLLKGQGLNKKNKYDYYNHTVIGYNYRMTNICAAIGLAQLKKLNQILKIKEKIFLRYQNNLKGVPVNFQDQLRIKKNFNSNWLISILCSTKKTRNNLINFLSKNKIETRTLFIPMHKLDIYKSKVKLANTEYIFDKGISLPSYPSLTLNDVDKICKVIKLFFKSK